jgi:hypothetical protein
MASTLKPRFLALIYLVRAPTVQDAVLVGSNGVALAAGKYGYPFGLN